MQSAPAESPLIGLALDNKYRVLRLIGRGGMGEVYEAEHVTLGKRVAIKLMLEKYTGDGEALARFTREALTASRIGDPHIIDVHDIGTAPDGRAFVVMEMLQGQPLSRVIEHGPLPPQRALAIMRQVLRAVGAAHAKGIVHRDLKPDNIFLLDGGDTRDFVKLLDFGISKVIESDPEAAATKLTTTGVVMGTPLYMAPEQAMGIEVTHRADVYACGVILYEMLAGRPPFEGATYPVLVAKLLTTEPPLLSELRPSLAPKLVAAVHRALEKEPDQRFATAEAFAAALPQPQSASAMELSATMPSGAMVAAGRPRRASRRRLPIIVAGAAFAIGAAVTGVVVARDDRAEAPPPAPSPAPAITTGTLEIGSEPAGATIFVDGHAWGPTPRTLTLQPGAYAVRLELAGHEPFEGSETVAAGSHRTVTPRLVPTPIAPPTPKAASPGRARPARAKSPPAASTAAARSQPPPITAPTTTAPPTPAAPPTRPAPARPEPARPEPARPEPAPTPARPKHNPYLGQ